MSLENILDAVVDLQLFIRRTVEGDVCTTGVPPVDGMSTENLSAFGSLQQAGSLLYTKPGGENEIPTTDLPRRKTMGGTQRS
jgi:hypothetical protein